MKTLNFALPDALKAFVQKQVKEGGYPGAVSTFAAWFAKITIGNTATALTANFWIRWIAVLPRR